MMIMLIFCRRTMIHRVLFLVEGEGDEGGVEGEKGEDRKEGEEGKAGEEAPELAQCK